MKKYRSDKTDQNSNILVTLKRTNSAVTEVVGTLLLLSIAISLTTFVSILALNTTFASLTTPVPSVSLIGTIDENTVTGNDQVIIQHCGGNELRLDTSITFIIAGEKFSFIADDLLSDEAKADGVWNIGERVNFTYGNLYDLQVEYLVIESELNTVLVKSIIREGETGIDPYVITLEATNITATSATLNLYYNFRFHYVDGIQNVSFSYREIYPIAGESTTFDWYNVSGNKTGYYDKQINVDGGTRYQFQAIIEYNESGGTNKILDYGNNRTFWTLDWIVGKWPFNLSDGDIALDVSRYGNNGTLLWNEIIGPQRVSAPLALSNRSLSFDGLNDLVFVSNSDSLALTDEITVELWMNPLENREGIVGEINELNISKFGVREFDFYEPDIIHVSGDIYAIVCKNKRSKGYVITVNISEIGEIKTNETTCIIDTLNFETIDFSVYEPEIIRLNNNKNIFVIVHRNNLKKIGSITTVEIKDDGIITGVNSTLDLEGSHFEGPEIIHVHDNVYAISYTGESGYGNITTISISDTGIIGEVIQNLTFYFKLSEIDILQTNIEIDKVFYAVVGRDGDNDGKLVTFNITNEGDIVFIHVDEIYVKKFDNKNARWPKIKNIAGEIYAIFYGIGEGQDFEGKIRTMNISSTGIITKPPSEGRTLFFEESSSFHEPEIINVNGNFYAIVYQGPEFDGFLKTVQINNTGTINQSFLESFKFEPDETHEPTIINVSSNNFTIVYRDNSHDGTIITITIADNGTINQIIDCNELGIFNCNEPDFIHVVNDIYVIAYRGNDDDGYLRTVWVGNNGSINNSIIDYMKFESTSCYKPNITHVMGNVYVIAYSTHPEGHGQGYLRTVNISDQGNISMGIGILEFENDFCDSPNIIHIDGNYYAIAYEANNNGSIITVEILPNGSINQNIIDFIEFYDNYISDPDIISITDTYYAIAYGAPSSGKISTIEIFNNGSINHSIINTSNFYTYACYFPKIIHIKNDIYAIVYGISSRGSITTVNISDTGVIRGIINEQNYYNFEHYQPISDTNLLHVVDDIYLIGYTLSNDYGYLKTLRIGDNGEVTISYDDVYCFPAFAFDRIFQPCLIHIHDNVFAMACRSRSENGYLITVEIDMVGTIRGIIEKYHNYKISANGTNIFATIMIGWAGEPYTLTGPITDGWNYFALTYNESAGMKLYRNSTDDVEEIANYSLTGQMEQNGWIIFGTDIDLQGYNCILDEITIYSRALDEDELQNSYDYVIQN